MNKNKKNQTWIKQRGQALAEFALVSPVLLMLAFGIIDFGRWAFTYSMALNALREASRNASILGYQAVSTGIPNYLDCDRISAQAQDIMFVDVDTVEVKHVLLAPDGSTTEKDCNTVSDSDLENGDILLVHVVIKLEMMTPFIARLVGPDGKVTIDMQNQRTIVKELELGDPGGNDSDFDGMDDDEELLYFGGLDNTALDDTDGDGLTNGRELRLGTNPNNPDTDGDGLNDGDEVDLYDTDPLLTDTDGDGLSDFQEVITYNSYGIDPNNLDTDADGLTDYEELFGTHPSNSNGYLSNPNDEDSDDDGVLDLDEILAGTNPSQGDTDVDGLSDFDEINTHGTDPLKPDTDDDGLWDIDEINTHGTDPLIADSDGDGLSDGDEVNIHTTDPLLIDSDGDGLLDGEEVNTHGTNPKKPDTDNDFLSDYQEVFVTGTDPTKFDTDEDGIDDYTEVNDYGPTSSLPLDPNLYDTYTGDAYANDYDLVVASGGTPGSATDTDGDGLPDDWEIRWFGDITSYTGQDDPDSDNYNNQFEFWRGTNPLEGDSDGDDISDGNEIFTFGTDPNNPDTDGDGLEDGDEVFVYFTKPLLVDTDGDGLWDGQEVFGNHPLNVNGYITDPRLWDTDVDGLNDYEEIVTHGTNPGDTDTDDDRLLDGEEVNTYGTDPLLLDTDGDGLEDGQEVFGDHPNNTNAYITDPSLADTDGDGLDDGDEIITYLTNPNDTDTDNDGLLDGAEVNTHGTDPNDVDTDDDLLSDGDEVNVYTTGVNDADPLLTDTDGDGLSDGEEVLVYSTYPNDPDSEDDGVNDGEEINNPDGYLTSSDPFHPNSDEADENLYDICNLTDDQEVNTYDTDPTNWDTDGDGIGDCEEITNGTDPLDATRIRIDDVTITEPAGQNQTVNMIFTVGLFNSVGTPVSVPAGSSITVNYSTVDYTAIAGDDYTQARGRITFNAGQSTQTITVLVNGDQGAGSVEGTETFNVVLSNATGGRIDKPVGVGTILDQDS